MSSATNGLNDSSLLRCLYQIGYSRRSSPSNSTTFAVALPSLVNLTTLMGPKATGSRMAT